jgi:hypothetical protein
MKLKILLIVLFIRTEKLIDHSWMLLATATTAPLDSTVVNLRLLTFSEKL